MAAFFEYIIGESAKTCVFLYFDCNYALGDSLLLPTEQHTAWCYSCEDIVAAELIPSLDEIDNRICDLDNPDNILRAFGHRQLDRERGELPIRRAWRVTRQSPARCLDCGSVDLYPLLANECTEPRFKKRFRLTASGHASMAFEIVRRLTPEGELIYTDDPTRRT